ncbi:MAG: class I SAM-dependent methyltransferase [Planctomycetes bacterium]|nr:class I SAM-dependent methyltransferase [Planctomycetota bacterium]
MTSEVETIRRAYDRQAPGYDQRWRSYLAGTLDAVLDGLDLRGDERVLDIACGTGELERFLFNRWPDLRVVGVDLSRGMLRQAAAKASMSRADWLVAGSAALPLPDCAFDWAICANSFHYFREPERALGEMRRVLRFNGTLILVDWCDDYLSCKLCSMWLRFSDPAFCRMYGMTALGRLVKQAGFQLERADRFRVGWIWGMMRLVCRLQPG